MDIQTILNNAMVARRSEEMKTSIQLTVGELILKLETVKNKDLPIVFDYKKFKPTGLGSWRGSYRELSIQYDGGGDTCYEQPDSDCEKDEFGYHHYKCKCGGRKSYNTSLPKKPKVKDLLSILKLSIGKFYVGYKGGDFTMGKTTPIWVANDGTSSAFRRDATAVVDILEKKVKVVIKTKGIEY